MGEAIFAKYSKSTSPSIIDINTANIISNTTKLTLGLSNGADLNDCLTILSLKGDSTHGTIRVTLKDVDGEPLGEHKIKMIDSDNKTLVYTTDGAGQCLFKTTAGQATFSEDGNTNTGYFDINDANSKSVDCPVGTVKMIELQRYKKLSNGYSTTFTSNQTIKFSKYANTLDATLRGESGQGGSAGHNWYGSNKGTNVTYMTIKMTYANNLAFWNIPVGTYFGNSSNLSSMWLITYYPTGSSGTCMDSGTRVAMNKGGNGGLGNIVNGSIDISNKSFNLVIPNTYSVKNYINIPLCTSSTSSITVCRKGYSGSTGGTTSGFNLSATGGRGGPGGGTTSTSTPDYGSGSLSGYPGNMTKGYSNISYSTDDSTRYTFSNFTLGIMLQSGNSCPGQITISNFQYK